MVNVLAPSLCGLVGHSQLWLIEEDRVILRQGHMGHSGTEARALQL